MDFPKLEIVTTDTDAAALALAFFQSEEKGKTKSEAPVYSGPKLPDVDALVKRLGESGHFSGKKGETDLLRFVSAGKFPNLLLVGLGKKAKVNLESLRRAGATIYHSQKRAKWERLAVQVDSFFSSEGSSGEVQDLQAFCEGYLLASYTFLDFKEPEKEPFAVKRLDLRGLKGAGAKEAVQRALALAKAVCFARSLGDKPGNILTPVELSRLVAEMAKKHKIKCTVFNEAQIQKEKMGLLLGVNQGSDQEPRFLVLEYRGGKKGDKPIALVGKGVTFDSGGISIKPAPAMEEMKYDMMGAATVAGIFQAAADLELPVNLNGYIAAVENMPSGRAQKPGDIKVSSKGKTVEITNTDAEGRLILADALEYAQKSDPQAIFDFATLTGAVLIALGNVATGIMGTSPELIDRLKKSADVSGERVWELPLYEEYAEDLKSSFADLRNSGNREAGSSKGGAFLQAFIDPKYPWVHCDIAGTAWNRKDANYHPPKNASGAMVRLMAHLLENWQPLKS